jgi:signal transduction histidine kinase
MRAAAGGIQNMHVSFQADDVAVRHCLLCEVGRRFGAATRLVLQEFIANVVEHCADRRVDVDVHPGGIVAMDYGGGFRSQKSRKPSGEGGYGLRLIRCFGGAVTTWERGMKLEYRFPADSKTGDAARAIAARLERLVRPARRDRPSRRDRAPA